MSRKSILDILVEIKKILEKEKELSTRQISIKTHSQWRTVDKALQTMIHLDLIKKRANKNTKRVETIYSIK